MACYPNAALHDVATCTCELPDPIDTAPLAIGELQLPMRGLTPVRHFEALRSQPRLSGDLFAPSEWDQYTESGR